ncbi:helix-turn-helix transcriptional regulator [Kitasatospora sp. GAS204B]|uniref:helix-turn-helix transcriptional regulator n=1 Tax=unclassified Kitasatospora TaxID=2633591 RepID=UPI002474C175|nr:helix-turn-helix transcriptional regulator [Kitasatospora sp. GAS204B]MDH6118479.1 transcriptional regulator with XRE-family HTH domain [Kitasatospora sp. GAS204B]
MSEQRNTALGDFLRSRRAALSPVDVGVPTYGTPRRVPGLRREEVAQLAGMSVNYYTRIEQGESHQLSDSVMEAIASALRLDEGERLHLLRLAWPAQVARRDAGPERVRDSVLALAGSNTEQAVLVVGRRMDLLGGNRLGFALHGLSPEQRPNMAKQMFLERTMRDLIVGWEREARNTAAYLRMATGDQPDDPLLAELIGELSIKSPEFARIWATHPVAECLHSVRQYDHPLVGRLTLNEESLRLPDDPGQRMLFLGAAPDSDSAERLRLLDSLVS